MAEALEKAGHVVTVLDTSCSDESLGQADVIFPVLHGVGGEDGQIQARLEKLGLAYVGSDSKSSRLCMNKADYRAKMVAAGYLMAEGAALTYEEYVASVLSKTPHVIKPIDGGSSIDTIIVRDVADRDDKHIADVYSAHERMLVEELIVGTEVTVGVLGENALPIIEIIPPQDGEFDYDNKYNGKTQELIPALHVSEPDQKAVQKLAEEIHFAAGCRDFSRTDFIITDDGRYYLLETNTIPGMTSQSLYPKMGAAIGLDMSALCDKLVGFALARRS